MTDLIEKGNSFLALDRPKPEIIALRAIGRGALVGWVSVRLLNGLAPYGVPSEVWLELKVG
jgi:hypothetical protein